MNPHVTRRILLTSLAKLVQPFTKKMEKVVKVGKGSSKSLSRAGITCNVFSSEFMDIQLVPSSLSFILPRLRVADQIQNENPRVAALCRFFAFKKAHDFDPESIGSGVRKFKTVMLQRLKEDSAMTKFVRADAKLLQNFYQQYYEKYMKELDESTGRIERSQLSRDYQITCVLLETLQEFSQKDEVKPAVLQAPTLDPASASQDIMQLPEVMDIEEGIFDEEEEEDNLEENNS